MGHPIDEALEADDEYETVDPSEFVDVPHEEALEAGEELTAKVPPVSEAEEPIELDAAQPPDREPPTVPLRGPSPGPLPPPVKVAKALSTTSVSIPPPPPVASRTMPPPPRSPAFEKGRVPPPPPFRRTSTSLPPPPRTTISSASLLPMSGTVPPVPTPPEDRSGGRSPAWSTKRTAAVAAIAAALAAAFVGAKRGYAPTSAPSSEVAAAIPAPEPQARPEPQAQPEPRAQPEPVATDPIATAPVVPARETAEPTPSPSPATTEHASKVAKESPAAENPKSAPLSASDRAELAAIALKVGATKAAACTMNFNTIPPSRIALDGRDLGMTPKLGVSVPPGTHVVTFANASGKKVTSAPCKPGEQKTVSMRFAI